MIKHVSVFTLKDKMGIDHFITLLEEVGKVITEGGIGVTISSQSGWRMEQLTALEDEQLALFQIPFRYQRQLHKLFYRQLLRSLVEDRELVIGGVFA